jgi:hypothetical protein
MASGEPVVALARASSEQSELRADTLGIKARMVEVLPREQGELYWEALGSFLTGKSTREEFELSTGSVLQGEMGLFPSDAPCQTMTLSQPNCTTR